MIQQNIILLIVVLVSALPISKAFAINDANSFRVFNRIKRSVKESIPNIIQINNELSEWPLQENNFIKNDLLTGQCDDSRGQRVYTDDILVENSGLSTLNGTLEIYIGAPIAITCVKVEDQISNGTGGIPSYHSGGVGFNWVFINVKCKYGKGFHFKIHIFGVPN